jgi:hypothetical protein
MLDSRIGEAIDKGFFVPWSMQQNKYQFLRNFLWFFLQEKKYLYAPIGIMC